MCLDNLQKALENAKDKLAQDDYDTIQSIIQKTKTAEVKKEVENAKGTENTSSNAEKYKDEGNVHFKNQQYSEAILSYTQAIEQNSTNAVYYSNRAAAYAKLNMNDDGIEDCKTAIKLDPHFVKAYIRLGDFFAVNDQENAKKYYEQALQIEPTNEVSKRKLQKCNVPDNAAKSSDNKNFDSNSIADLLKNPEIMDMAKNLMKDKSPEELEKMMKDMLADMKK